MIQREIEIIQAPEDPCPDCGEVLEDLAEAVAELIRQGRDGYMTSQCPGCKSVLKAQTKIVYHSLSLTMSPPVRTDIEKRTGMSGKVLEKGELPSGSPRPQEQEAVRLAIKEAKAKPKKKGSK